MNRDEYFKRPTSAASWDEENILAGRDQEPGKEGGTWLGMNKKAKIGLLTNIYTGKANPGAGRGFLVIDYLKQEGSDDASYYLKNMSMLKASYSPFNLILFEPQVDVKKAFKGHYYCRGLQGCSIEQDVGPIELEPGYHGLGNHPKNCPYNKTVAGIEQFQNLVEQNQGKKQALVKDVFAMMSKNHSFYPDDQMIKQGGQDSPMIPYHPKLASIFVEIPDKNYGTRVQTVILVDFDKHVTYIERSRTDNGQWSNEQRHEFIY
jgi:uncharacterized protein with NRDE domain